MPRRADLAGQRFGLLTAVSFHDMIELSGVSFRRWRCLCDCGSEVFAIVGSLRSGNTKSCGCWKVACARERLTKHGRSRSPEYNTWQSMLQRCENSASSGYTNYGGRGIKVCEAWHDFSIFFRDVGRRPSRDMTLERRDNNGDYGPGNCVWASRVTQNRNQRLRADNTSGVTGVVWHPRSAKWEAFIGIGGSRVYLGLFVTTEEASQARRAAMKANGFNPNHGGPRNADI